MSRGQKALVVRVALFACLFLSGCFVSTPINITGTWVGTMEWTSGPATGIAYPVVLDLTHENHELTGTVTLVSHGSLTFDLPIVQGSARAVNMSLVARGTNPNINPEPTVEFRINGQYSQTSMSGQGTQSIDGTTYSFDWEAALTTEPVPAAL